MMSSTQIGFTVLGILALIFGVIFMWSSVEITHNLRVAGGLTLGALGVTVIFLAKMPESLGTNGRDRRSL